MRSPPSAAGVHWANDFLLILMGRENILKIHPKIGEDLKYLKILKSEKSHIFVCRF
jgi:hypothetical protein